MKATGIVRRLDDLGRIVLPKEIRKRQGLTEGTPMEIFIEDDCVILKPYMTAHKQTQREAARMGTPCYKLFDCELIVEHEKVSCTGDCGAALDRVKKG